MTHCQNINLEQKILMYPPFVGKEKDLFHRLPHRLNLPFSPSHTLGAGYPDPYPIFLLQAQLSEKKRIVFKVIALYFTTM
jgi:hypothetical protein